MMEQISIAEVKISDEIKEAILKNFGILEECYELALTMHPIMIDALRKEFVDFIPYFPFYTHPLQTDFIFERIVINKSVNGGNNHRLKEFENIIYPPIRILDKIDFNRANFKGVQAFYAGASGGLPINVETKPQRGDLITHSYWRLKEGETINIFPICQSEEIFYSHGLQIQDYYQYYLSLMSSLDKNLKDILDRYFKLMTKAFNRKVNPNNKKEYLISALFSEFIFNVINADAIYYPSVPNGSSAMNIVIKPTVFDQRFEFVKANESIVITDPLVNGIGWGNHTTGTCKKIENNNLIWVNQPLDTSVTIGKYNLKELFEKHQVSLS